MQKDFIMRAFIFVLSLIASPLAAHEFWLEPLDYQIADDGRLEAHIVNGQSFEGVKLSYLPQRFVRFEQFVGMRRMPVQGRLGSTPALNAPPLTLGLNVVIYQSTTATVNYETWEKFQRFVDHKDFGDVRALHDARDLPADGFGEVYSRYAKTLINVGDGTGADLRTGLETEIVALTNPYTDDLSEGMRVQVFYGDDVRIDTQVEVFDKAPDDTVVITMVRTDAEGIAVVPVIAGHSYMLDAVVLREPSTELAASSNAVWETLWANLTFGVPE
ncbi:MAG: DUF4198 domain-containing protein [Octadecabacter sp.]